MHYSLHTIVWICYWDAAQVLNSLMVKDHCAIIGTDSANQLLHTLDHRKAKLSLDNQEKILPLEFKLLKKMFYRLLVLHFTNAEVFQRDDASWFFILHKKRHISYCLS